MVLQVYYTLKPSKLIEKREQICGSKGGRWGEGNQMKLVKIYKFSVVRKTTNPERGPPSQLIDHKRRTRLSSIFLEEGNGNPVQYSCLENPMDRGAWQAARDHGTARVRHDLAPFLSHGSIGKESACNAGDLGSIPGLGRCPGEGNGNPLRYS